MQDWKTSSETVVDRRLLTVKETADTLAVSVRTVWNMIGDARLEAVRLGRCTRIPIAEVERLVREGGCP